MTSRQRIEAALAHRDPDRTPIFEYVLLPPLADRLLGREYVGQYDRWSRVVEDVGWDCAVQRAAVDKLELALRLAHDMLYVTPNPPPPQSQPNPPAKQPPPPDDPVERLVLRNERAEAAIAPPGNDCLLIYRYLREEMARRGVDLPILAPAYQHGIWTDVDLMQTMLLAPRKAQRHFQLATRRALGWIDKYIALGIDQIGVGGDFAGNRPIISPAAYREFIMPEVRVCSQRVHEGGCYAVNASDGNLWSVSDDFLLGCEVDGYLEIDSAAGMDLRKLKRSYGDRITFYGNLDCGSVLSFASPDDVRRHVTDCIEAGAGSGHILCASNAITASVPLENYLAVVRAYRDVFGLPELVLD